MSQQYLRQASLVVANSSQQIDLSQLRFTFQVRHADMQTPNNLYVRVYNVADATVTKVKNEFTAVTLQCGYQNGPFGVIFQGTIKQFRSGRESATETYLDILAADGDIGLNNTILNTTLAAGSSPQDRFNAMAKALATQGITVGAAPTGLPNTQLPRGKTLFGMARDQLRAFAATYGYTYSIQNGKINFVPLTGVLPGEAVVINSATGMIGIPEQTDLGFKVRMLINPSLQIGSKLQINNADIQNYLFPLGLGAQAQNAFTQVTVKLNADGLYRIYTIDHIGDTRGNEWYSDAVCLALDAAGTPHALVNQGLAYGNGGRGGQ